MEKKFTLGVVLFEEFELLDVCGPLEIFGSLPKHFNIKLVAEHSGVVSSSQGPQLVINHTFCQEHAYDIILIPGVRGTRREVDNVTLLEWLKTKCLESQLVTSVCTGSALLAKTGMLDGKRATTNKAAFKWVTAQGEKVEWVPQARWVEDGKFFTSSGVSAGMDMSLALVSKLLGDEVANRVAIAMEYEWHRNPDWDPFAEIHGLVTEK